MSLSPEQQARMLDTLEGCWISLHIADPLTNGGSEVAGAGYARQPGVLAPTVAGTKALLREAIFRGLPAAVLTHFGVWSAPQGGTFLWGDALDRPAYIFAGDAFRFDRADLAFSVA
jgi:hypothetical protein